jgi:hypothetical protein
VAQGGTPDRLRGQVGVRHLIGHANCQCQVGEVEVARFVVLVEVHPAVVPGVVQGRIRKVKRVWTTPQDTTMVRMPEPRTTSLRSPWMLAALMTPRTTATRLSTLADSRRASVVARRGSSLVAWALVDTASRRPMRTQIVTTHVTAAADQASSGTVCQGATSAATMPTTAPTPEALISRVTAESGCLKSSGPRTASTLSTSW